MPAASSLTVWIAGAVFLAGGFAAGYVVGQGGDALDAEEPPELERLRTPRPATSPVRTLERQEHSAKEEAHLESTRAVELAPLRDLLDALPPIDAPRGSGVVTGSVQTPEGTGVAGVEITLHPSQPDQGKRGYGWYDDEDLTVAAKHVIESLRWRRFARLQTVTGPDGAFRFDTVADLDHHADARREGWQIRPTDPRRSYQARPGATLDFIAHAVVRIPITIVMPDGSTPTTAMVMVAVNGGSSGTGWSAQRPYAELQPGTWEVTAQAGDAQQFKSEPQTVTVEAGVAPPPLRFELESTGGIRGKVEFAPGEVFQQGRVYLARIPKGQKPDPSRLATSEQSTHLQSWGGPSPTFTFSDLTPGRYLVGLGRTYQGAVTVTREVEVRHEVVEVVLEVPPLGREEYVVVSVLDPEGKPLAGAQLAVGRESGGSRSSSGATVIEREDGTRWVLHQEGDADADTTWWVTAVHPQYGKRRVEYGRTRASAVDLRFDKPGTLEVTVTGLVGTRYEGRMRAGLTGWRSFPGDVLDGSGRVTLSGVQPGIYSLALNLGGDRGRGSQIHTEEVEIRSGENRLRIEVPPLYEVEVLGVQGRAYVRGTSNGPGRSRFSLNLNASADGRATIDGLPAGEYEVRSGRKRARFSVPGATTVRLE
jgi:hypothetical protein